MDGKVKSFFQNFYERIDFLRLETGRSVHVQRISDYERRDPPFANDLSDMFEAFLFCRLDGRRQRRRKTEIITEAQSDPFFAVINSEILRHPFREDAAIFSRRRFS